jgi:pimeloyl-ACP methyl ester carboxylesterase
MLSVRRVAAGGTPAVFVHGLGGSSLNWTDLMLLMAGRLDSWSVDLPGFGWSPPPRDGDYTPAGHAAAVADLIREKIGVPVHLFGNSMGGAVSVALAADHPDLVRSVTLISPALPGARMNTSNMHLPVVAVPGVGERLVDRYLRAPAEWRARATIEVCYGDMSRMHPQRMAEAVAEVERRDRLTYAGDAFTRSTRGLIRAMLARGRNSPLAQASRVSAPVLLVYGRLDRLVDSRGAHTVAANFPDARVVVLPDSGHVAQMEHAEMVAGVWSDLLDSPHPRTAG